MLSRSRSGKERALTIHIHLRLRIRHISESEAISRGVRRIRELTCCAVHDGDDWLFHVGEESIHRVLLLEEA